MQTEEMVAADEFCIHHNIELSFIYSLKDSGLVEVTSIGEKIFVPVSQLGHLERLVRLYYEMDINLEGIETITYLLQQMNDMQQQIVQLSNRLSMYDHEWNESFDTSPGKMGGHPRGKEMHKLNIACRKIRLT